MLIEFFLTETELLQEDPTHVIQTLAQGSSKPCRLHLAHCRLGRKPTKFLQAVFSSLGNTVYSLNLESNFLEEKLADSQLEQVLSSLPKRLIALNLNENCLAWTEHPQALLAAMQALPRTIKILDLSKNFLGFLNEQNLQMLLQSLPPSLEHLALCDNSFSTSSDLSYLKPVFANLPKNIRHLDLRYNQFGNLTINELWEFLEAIPSHVQTIQLSIKELFQNHSDDGISKFHELLNQSEQPRRYVFEKNIVHDELLKNTVIRAFNTAVTNYQNWYYHRSNPRGKHGWFTSFRHGSHGQKKALEIQQQINQCGSYQQVVHTINTWLKADNTRYHRHSFASFVLDRLRLVENSPWDDIACDPITLRYRPL